VYRDLLRRAFPRPFGAPPASPARVVLAETISPPEEARL